MTIEKLLKLLSDELEIKGYIFEITRENVETLVLDVSRVLDGRVTEIINLIKDEQKIKIDSHMRENLRKKILGYPISVDVDTEKYLPLYYDSDIVKGLDLINEGFERNSEIMISSLVSRLEVNFLKKNKSAESYIEYIFHEQKGKSQLQILTVTGSDMLNANQIADMVNKFYDSLSNYHYMIIRFVDDNNQLIKWETVSDVALYMEQFKKEYNFASYNKRHKEHRISEMKDFLKNNNSINYNSELEESLEEYYSAVSYGFYFDDLFISSDGKEKVLVMQKVELDETSKKCPECHEEILTGNSYPRVLMKSFECKNPFCPARSKIGRGKRFDVYSAKRQAMVARKDKHDLIDVDTHQSFRRDIMKRGDITNERLVHLYSWAGDSVTIINSKIINNNSNYLNRKIEYVEYKVIETDVNISNLSLYKFFRQISKSITINSVDVDLYTSLDDEIKIINANSNTASLESLAKLSIHSIGGAVTSPPYYNAREYSQWPSLYTYLIDMMINAKTINNVLDEKGTYIYNIGDIVDQDNVFIKSNMSKRRQMLGFYSILIFKNVGFHIKGNIIWDKGEVQSKRNSTSNHMSGYLKPINCYEHCLIFMKDVDYNEIPTLVKKIPSVKKINSKGENILGHTAPFPIDIPNLILPFLPDSNSFVIDPFLGSGTTLVAMKKQNVKAVGYELNPTYYQLSIDRISLEVNNISDTKNS